MSWAVPGQGGHKHVNNHSNDYIRELMALHGLKTDLDAEKTLRLVARLPWFKNTIMVFRFTKKRC